MDFLKKHSLVFLLLVFTVTVIYSVYWLLDKDSVADLIIPNNLSLHSYSTYIADRLPTAQDKEFVSELYDYFPSKKVYKLKSSITDAEISKFKSLLIASGYYVDFSTIDRDLHTHAKRVLNGYLGQFFRFRLLGVLNWLFIPAVTYYLFVDRKFSASSKILLAAVLVCICIVTVYGYNYRYQLTFVPVILSMALLFIDDLLELWDCARLKLAVYCFLSGLMVINILKYFGSLTAESVLVSSTVLTSSKNTENWSSESSSMLKMANFINSLSTGSTANFLINNLPFFYYYTDKSGIYYWAYDDILFYASRRELLFTHRSVGDVYTILFEELNCRYILSSHSYNSYNPRFDDFLRLYTIPIFQTGDYVLYEVLVPSDLDDFSQTPLQVAQ